MQNMKSSIPPGRSSDFFIRINDFTSRIVSGTIEHSSTGDSTEFHGLMCLVEAVHDKLEEAAFPQAVMALRRWGLPEMPPPDEASFILTDDVCADDETSCFANTPGKPLASFLLRIQFRQNASWQGSLAWMEARKSMAFRSMLEFIFLLDQAAQYASTIIEPASSAVKRSKWKNQESVS